MKIKNKIIKEYSDSPIDDLAGKPVYALSGISDRNALTLYKVFHIETIHDLGNLEFARRAGKICEAADKGESSLHGDFAETALKKKFRTFTPALLRIARFIYCSGSAEKMPGFSGVTWVLLRCGIWLR